jgi:hypothetical protein
MNPIGINLQDRIVVLRSDRHGGDENQRRFLCKSGFGLQPFTNGSSVTGIMLHIDKMMTINSDDIEKLWENPLTGPPPVTQEKATKAASETVIETGVEEIPTAQPVEEPKPEPPKPEPAKPAPKPEPAKSAPKPEPAKPVAESYRTNVEGPTQPPGQEGLKKPGQQGPKGGQQGGRGGHKRGDMS